MSVEVNPEFKILLVDDEVAWLRSLSMTLEGPGGFTNLIQTDDSREVMSLFQRHDIGVVLLDLTMPNFSGTDLLKKITTDYPAVQVVILSGMNQLETAVQCMRAGAFDYFVKTVEEDRLLDGVRRAVRMVELQRENHAIRRRLLSRKLEHPAIFADIVTQDAAMLAVFSYVESIATSRQPLLILGESGVGKELIARAAHQLATPHGPLVSVNVAGLDDNVFADTLFGHRRGAFTGADQERSGMVERAAGGSLFLDEIGDLSAASQVKLLRLLQEGEYYPLGGDIPCQSRARIICATHQDLSLALEEGRFRKDLYYRLHAHPLRIPPLRERRDDIPLLLNHFLHVCAKEQHKPTPTAPPKLATLLKIFKFPGNVRELHSLVHDAVSRHRGGTLSLESFLDRLDHSPEPLISADKNPFQRLDELPTLRQASEWLVDAAIERANGNQSLAARLLGISQPALSKRLKQRRYPQNKRV